MMAHKMFETTDETVELSDIALTDDQILVWENPKYACQAEVVPGYTIVLEKWPSRWHRFWHRVFFGVVWEPCDYPNLPVRGHGCNRDTERRSL